MLNNILSMGLSASTGLIPGGEFDGVDYLSVSVKVGE